MINGDKIILTTDLQQAISAEQAWHYKIVPFETSIERDSFYTLENLNTTDLANELEMVLGKSVALKAIDEAVLNRALNKYYRRAGEGAVTLTVDDDYDEFFVSKLIAEAKALGSSDIHIEIYDEKARIRLRIDGGLVEKHKLNKDEYNGLISVIKLKSGLDIAERRKPQDGRYSHETDEESFDLRVAIIPTLRGEKVVMRILSNDKGSLLLDDLGFSEKELKDYRSNVYKHNGIVLISGPTGSGKTTTLYATLQELNKEDVNIMTVEDPVEYTLDGINQVQVKEDIGLTFSEVLRSFLRHDPNIIMLGEIRDETTAEIAVRLALTGHIVLSTIHTNSAWEITTRLVDMGIPSFLVSSTLNMAVSQRLVRTLCPKCKKASSEPIELPSYFKATPPEKHFVPVGCDACYHTGYKGRKAIYEVIPIDRDLSALIKEEKNTVEAEELLNDKGIRGLSNSAFELFITGVTSFEEVYPIIASNF
ncbi:MAG: GspE/PulE family protein [Flavobacteriales bacterium]|jgi:general secretion pathway protein E/type IV pilus assembly protein PilB|nr:GspE/PulE family protein [Flavobacteriales bacterium]